MVSAVAAILTWIVLCLLYVQVVDPTPAFFSYLVGLGFYPLVSQFFTGAQRVAEGPA